MKPPFDKVVQNYIRLVYFFARRWAKKVDVDDAVQSTFLKAQQAYNAFSYKTEGELKSWLLTICRNNCIDMSTKSTTITLSPEELDESVAGPISPSDEWLDKNHTEKEMAKILALLSECEIVEQEIVRLRIYEEMSFKEISKVFESTEEAVKMRYYRIIKKLQQSL